MSWFLRLTPVVIVCACGGTTITREGDGGGAGNGAVGGEVGNGGTVGNGGKLGSGGTVDDGGTTGVGGHIWAGGTVGSGGNPGRVPMNHRATAVACGVRPPAPDAAPPQGQSPGFEACMTDAECKSGPNGRCVGTRTGFACTYDACFNDSDCGEGSVCACGTGTGQGSHCLNPGCQVDADCPGSFCSPTFGTCGAYLGVVSYQCHTQRDECLDDSECTSPTPGNCCGAGFCAYDPNLGHFACSYTTCAG